MKRRRRLARLLALTLLLGFAALCCASLDSQSHLSRHASCDAQADFGCALCRFLTEVARVRPTAPALAAALAALASLPAVWHPDRLIRQEFASLVARKIQLND